MKILDYLKERKQQESDDYKYYLCGRAVQDGVCRFSCSCCAWKVSREEEKDNGRNQMDG